MSNSTRNNASSNNSSRQIIVSLNNRSSISSNDNTSPISSPSTSSSTTSMYSPRSLNVFYQQQHPNYVSVRSKSPIETLHNLSQMYTNLMNPNKIAPNQRQLQSHLLVNRSNNDIENEFANLTISIDREIEKHKNINEYYGVCIDRDF
jgi:hypothetical protein